MTDSTPHPSENRSKAASKSPKGIRLLQLIWAKSIPAILTCLAIAGVWTYGLLIGFYICLGLGIAWRYFPTQLLGMSIRDLDRHTQMDSSVRQLSPQSIEW